MSRETDIAVRSFFAQRGMKKGDLSRFTEDAVAWRELDQTMVEACAGFADLSTDAVEALADEVVTSVRRANKALTAKAR